MALIDYIEDKLPGWMRLAPLAYWRDLAGAMAAVIDAMIEGLYDGRLASFPGQTDELPNLGGYESSDALPLIGRDRLIVRGPAEPIYDYARRLRYWRAARRGSGTAYVLLSQLRGVMGPNPTTARLVTGSGLWYSFEAGGDFVLNTPTGAGGFRLHPDGTSEVESDPAYPWNWDNDPDNGKFFVIVYAPTNVPLQGDGSTYGPGKRLYGEVDGTLGTTATPGYIEMIRGLLDQFKPAGITCPWIIVAFDASSFDPLAAPGSVGYPNGTWRNHGLDRLVSGRIVRVRARNSTARYWVGTVRA